MKLRVGLLAILLPCCWAGEAKTVLTVSSYRVSYEWSADVVRGIHEVLRESDMEIATFDEFLDSRRDPAWERNFVARYQALHGKRSFDLAILIDDEAVSLACGPVSDQWRVPLVVTGITEMPACLTERSLRVTGILERFNSRGLIDIGIRGLPGTQSVVLITDGTPLSDFLAAEVRAAFSNKPGIRIEEWKGKDHLLADVIGKVATLPPNTLVYLASFVRDKSGGYMPATATYRRIVAAANVPVIALSHHSFPGLLAASPNGGVVYGREVGALALRVLAGTDPRSIPVALGKEVVPEVEEESLRRWGIPESRLPAGVQIIRRHPSLFQQYRPWIIGGAVFMLAQMLLIAALAVNIERRRKAEAALVARNEQLVAAAEAKNRFVANISHELRTPLNGVMGMSDVLLDAPMGDEERECVQTIRSSAGHLLRILNDILDVSRLDSGRFELIERPYSPKVLVQEAVTLFLPEAAPGVVLSGTVSERIPEFVIGDPVRVRQVLFNLTGNAMKFTSNGSVEVCADYVDGRLRLTVIDTGTGIAAAKLDHIFDRFVQADDSTTRKHGGLGLGLAIAKEIVQAMGGTITVESTIGKGSRFCVEMPAKTAQQAEMTEVRESAPALRGKRVLVAEDNRVNIAVVERLLRRLACECTTATDGASAARMAVSGRFDAILMDLQMPQADGFEATRTIRASGVDAPIIALTASAVDGERERCLAAGMNDYLSKPIDRKRLEAVLVRWTINAPAGRH